MPTITVPDDTYNRLTRRATALGTTAEALALPALERAAADPRPVAPVADSAGDTLSTLTAWMAAVEARADRYPAGHVTDVSREAVYEGCGE